MPTITKTCNRIQQTSGGDYQTFLDLNNLKLTDSSAYAQTELIRAKSKTPNRPALLLLSDFRFNLPVGAVVRNIEIIYNHELVAVNNEVCQIGKPTIVIQGISSGLKATSQEGHAPSTTGEIFSRNFSCNIGYAEINSDKFAVQFRYPKNANDYSGYLRIRNIWVKLTYIVPEFDLTLKKTKGKYNGDTFEFVSVFSNKQKTSYKPWVTINLPLGISYESHTCKGSLEVISARVLRWIPGIYGISSDTLTLECKADVTYAGSATEYTGTIDISEALNGTYRSLTFSVFKPDEANEQAETNDEVVVPNEDMLPVDPVLPYTPPNPNGHVTRLSFEQGEYFNLYLGLNAQEIANTGFISYGHKSWALSFYNNTDFEIDDFSDQPERYYTTIHKEELNAEGYITTRFYQNLLQDTTAILWSGNVGSSEVLRRIDFSIYPNDVSPPCTVMMELSPEELNRLGHGYTYTVQSFVKIGYAWPGARDKKYDKDWKHNYRIGVYNQAISENVTVYPYTDENGEIQEIVHDTTNYDELTVAQIFDNTIWSAMSNKWEYDEEAGGWYGVYEDLTVTFPYNKNYPLYIIITGDYVETNLYGTVLFTEPCIVESTDYQGIEPNGLYPTPIENTLDNESYANETIPAYATSETLIFYDLPLPEDFGTDTEIAIRGIEVTGDIERSDELVMTGKLINQGNESRTRTIILNGWQADNDNTFQLGQHGDNWGFKTEQIKDFEDWEIHLTPNNTISDSSSLLSFHDINVGLYVETIDHLPFKTYIEGEDVTYYGVFITDVTIPEGLKTDTDYLNVSGRDTNWAYSQAIREKDIEIEIEIGDTCDLEANTIALRDFIKLLTNERTKYNQPIPKRIEFSHYPDLYWEYILEDAVKPELEINTYKLKVKLTVPSGTAYTKTATQTHTSGFVNGLAHINPVITVKPTSSTLLIRETETGQTFQMGYTDYEGKFYEIDCENRKVYIKTNIEDSNITDISSYVDINSDWFRLLGEFYFETTNCAIHDVKYHERW